MGDDPPYLTVGTEVSAKYKGAFCEAKVRKVVKNIKCKVLFKLGQGTALVSEEYIRGTLRVGAQVEAKHPDKNQFMEATINKVQDVSQYTVVFDDGDITTLRRSALCLKSGRHFAESETLDQLPLTHPEHFGTPVVGGRRGRRSFPNQEGSSEDEEDEDPPSKNRKEDKEPDLGKLVCVEIGDKKKSKDNWFPGLVVAPTAQDTVHIRVKDEYLVRSFKDGRYYTVPKKEAVRFTREIASKVDNTTLRTAVEKALLFLDKDELPPHWDRDLLFGLVDSSSSDEEKQVSEAESSDDEPREQKDHFVAQLYKFMDDRGTPINKGPTIEAKDLDLYRLFMVVHKQGGFNRVSNQNGWKSVSQKLGLLSKSANSIKIAYKKYLHGFEDFYRKLGCTMINSPRSNRNRHRSGRSLIRDKDKATSAFTPKREEKDKETPKVSPCPVPEEEKPEVEDKEEKPKKIVEEIQLLPPQPLQSPQVKIEIVEEEEEEKKVVKPKKVKESRDSPIEEVETKKRQPREKNEPKVEGPESAKRLIRRKKPKTYASSDEETEEKESPIKRVVKKTKEPEEKVPQVKPVDKEDKDDKVKKKVKKGKKEEERKDDDIVKKKVKRTKDTENANSDDETLSQLAADVEVNVGDILRVYYDLGSESKVTYEAKVCDARDEGPQKMYYVHYTGWNTRYDEWIKRGRIAENVSLSSSPNKAKKTRNSKPPVKDIKASSSPPKASTSTRRSRSIGAGRSDSSRSATPSSIASSSSRTAASANAGKNSSETGSPTKADVRRRSRRISELSCVTESDSSGDEDANSDEMRPTSHSPRRPPRYAKQNSDSGSKDDDDESSNNATKEEAKKPVDDKKEEGPKGKDFDLRKIRSELKMPVDASPPPQPVPVLVAVFADKKDKEEEPRLVPKDPKDKEQPPQFPQTTSAKRDEDIYEFREPEPFEFEVRPTRKEVDDKATHRFGRKSSAPEEETGKKTPKKSNEREKSPVKKPDEEKTISSPVPATSPAPAQQTKQELKLFDNESHASEAPPKDPAPAVITVKEPVVVETKIEVKEKEISDKPVMLPVVEPDVVAAVPETPPIGNITSSPSLGAVAVSQLPIPTPLAVKRAVPAVMTAIPAPSTVPAEMASAAPHSATTTPVSKIIPALIGTHRSPPNPLTTVSPIPLTSPDKVKETVEDSRITAVPKAQQTPVVTLPAFIPHVMPALSALASKYLTQPNPGTIATSAPPPTAIVVVSEAPVVSDVKPLVPEKSEKGVAVGSSSAKKDARRKSGKKGQPISKEFIESDSEDSSSGEIQDSQTVESPALTEDISVSPVVEVKPELVVLPEIERPRTPPQPIKKQKLVPKSDEDQGEASAESISLLFCQETIPGSPVAYDRSAVEDSGLKPCELPFASAPGTSHGQQAPVPVQNRDNSAPRPPRKRGLREMVAAQQRVQPRPVLNARLAAPVVAPVPAVAQGASASSAAVLDNTPPTTPEGSPSSLSGSPVGERCGRSPDRDEQSLKSETSENDSEHSNSEPPSISRPPASSTITMRLNGPGAVTNSVMASRVTGMNVRRKETVESEEATPSPLKRRKKSTPRQEGDPPPRRGRPPNNSKSPRRTGSDTEDTFETYMNQHNIAMADPNRSCRYNFCVMLDPELDANQRITVLQEKMRELRNTYVSLKTQLAVIDKRRKKLRRKERESKALSSKSQSS